MTTAEHSAQPQMRRRNRIGMEDSARRWTGTGAKSLRNTASGSSWRSPFRSPAERVQLANGPFTLHLHGQKRQRSYGGSEHYRLSAKDWWVAVGRPAVARLVGPFRDIVLMNVNIAVIGVMMVLARGDRSRDVVHRMRHQRSRRRAERDGRDQTHQASKEPAQNRHGAWDSVALSGRQGVRSKRQTWRAASCQPTVCKPALPSVLRSWALREA